MSDEERYDDDDFYSDDVGEDEAPPAALQAIVEVPGEAAASDHESEEHDTDSQEEGSDYESSEEEDFGEITPVLSQSQKTKKKVKSPFHTEITPPDQLLKRTVQKVKKYSKIPKKSDAAIKALIKCTALCRIVYGDRHWKLAEAHTNLAEGYADIRGYYPQAQQHTEFARDIMTKNVHSPESSQDKQDILLSLIKLYYILGRACTQNKKYKEATNALSEAEKLCRELTRHQTDWNIKVFTAIAKLNARRQSFALALTYFENVLELNKKKHGKRSTKLIPIYQNLGTVEQSKGDKADQERAIEYFVSAHDIAAASYKPNSVEIAQTATCLAAAYSSIDDEHALISAEKYYNEALTTYLGAYGSHHERTIEAQDDLACLMIRQIHSDKSNEGIDLLKSNVSAKKEVYGDLSVKVADSWKLIGSTYLSKGDMDKALKALQKCHQVECNVYGTKHKKTLDTQKTINLLLSNPRLASKHKKSQGEDLKERPRYSTVVKNKEPLGGCKY